MSSSNYKGFTTKALNVPFPKQDPYNALHMPVYEGVAYGFDDSKHISDTFQGKVQAHTYSRTSNPTVQYLEHKIKALTGANHVLALSSGMAAISSTILSITKAGDNIISSNHLFGHTYAILDSTLREFDIETRFTDLSNIAELKNQIDSKTRAIYFETVTNPQLEVLDLEELSAFASEHNLLLICDSTMTPLNTFNSSEWGVNIEVMSTTKFISGGATSVGGLIIDNGNYDWSNIEKLKPFATKFGKDALAMMLRKNIFRNFGACMSPQAAHYQNMGLDILELRVSKAFNNCLILGDYLQSHPKVTEVNYPGLSTSSDYELVKKQFNGIPGTIMTFSLTSEEACYHFMDRLCAIRRATNLNDNKSLIIHPYSTIYSEFTYEERNEMNISPTMMRLSVGIEYAEDLMADIEQALSAK